MILLKVALLLAVYEPETEQLPRSSPPGLGQGGVG
jgi:hypothetical protein